MTQKQTQNQQSPRDRWQDWATRATAILAVLAALSSGRWGASNLQAILEQGKVNDAWSYYQAKSVKQHVLEQTRDLAGAIAAGTTDDRAAPLKQLQEKLDRDSKREARDKSDAQARALEFEARRNVLVESSMWLQISFGALQLGVILATIAAGTRFRVALVTGIVLGVLGLVLLINGFHPFIHMPQSWYQGATKGMEYAPGST